MMLIQIPEDVYIVVDHITAIGPRYLDEYTQEPGATIHLTSGETFKTEETIDGIILQIAETIKQASHD